ncbi:hypothetical protein LEP1GSC060_0216 [Leptospira weilii serovar Ranarum str. ICFT]|uniref:Uncharacterized protein n=1 Tax=Leptospira weilii serovar Ranarum str. ICFT TaxID=1218598 RepID=N1WH81_9LEPT|nr:hypothetical protein LEP1GSC060_0216 [Leptospira weilii serovar Ranarum str. ICFT]
MQGTGPGSSFQSAKQQKIRFYDSNLIKNLLHCSIFTSIPAEAVEN